ncbi:cytochrome P450 [Mycena latifolia]|nr:cytochrome P450 [Mycena latifolia]
MMKAKLSEILAVVQDAGTEELNRVRSAVGKEGKIVSLHSLLYRVGYNVNCVSLFGKSLDHVTTRILLQTFMRDADELVAAYGWPIPLWVSQRIFPGVRRCVKAKNDMHAVLVKWDKAGGSKIASGELRAILGVFEQANTPMEVRSTWTNMAVTAFMGNTPEAFGWLFTNLVQAPVLFAKVREECDALGDGSLVELDFKKEAPHLYSALFESFRMYVMMGTSAIVKKNIVLPGINHTFKSGDILKAMGPAAAMSVENYGEDAEYWKGHRFVGEGDHMLQYDLTFSTGRSPCPGRSFALAELLMLSANLIRDFDFSEFQAVKALPLDADDFEVMAPVTPETKQIIDLDGNFKTIVFPGNRSDVGPPGMTSANIPLNDFACRLKIRA